jgi:hypothetical protein
MMQLEMVMDQQLACFGADATAPQKNLYGANASIGVSPVPG